MPRSEVFEQLTGGGWSGIIEVNWNQRASQYAHAELGAGGWPFRYLIMAWKFLVGFYIGRRMLRHRDAEPIDRRIMALALVIGLACSLPRALPRGWTPDAEVFHVIIDVLDEIGVVALSIAYACILVTLHRHAPRVIRWLAPMGRMALTNYLMQSVLFVVVFYGVGLELLGRLGQITCVGIAVAFYAFQIVISAWWLSRFRFGPAEWAWRCMTYGRLQPMRIRTA